MAILKYLIESLISEEETNVNYPNGFDIKELNNIRSFAGKQKYVAQHLEKIGAGSSRIVYRIDDTHVLKLAKNDKGLAQNSVEGDFSMHQYYSEFIPELIEVDDDYLWIIKERVNKITKKEFEKLSGYKFEDFSIMLKKLINDRTSNKPFWGKIDQETYDDFIDDEFIVELCDFIINFDMEVGDIGGSITNWGKSEKHDDNPVLTDVGLSKSVWNDHYSKNRRR